MESGILDYHGLPYMGGICPSVMTTGYYIELFSISSESSKGRVSRVLENKGTWSFISGVLINPGEKGIFGG